MALFSSYRRHRRPWALLMGIMGGAFMVTALAVHFIPRAPERWHDVIWPGMALVVAAIVLDVIARRRAQ